MRRSQFDKGSQPVTNLLKYPSFESSDGTTLIATNIAQNPSFEKTSGTVDVRTNLFTNPAFDGVTGLSDVRANWANNPSFEATSGTVNVRTNFAPNPAMDGTSGTTVVRTNLAVNPRMTNFNFGGYGSQTLSSISTGVTAHPEQITTAVRTSYNAGAVNPGVIVMPLPDVSTQYTVSGWVYNEGPSTESIAIALKGSSSGGAQDVPVGVWTRLAWTMTTPATLGSGNDFGFRIGSPSATGSFLTTGVLIEKSPITDSYFDGTTALTNLANNPSFDVNVTGWNAVAGTPLSRDTTKAYLGGASMKVDTSGIASSYVGAAQTLALVAGATYTISAYVWAPSGTYVNFAPDVIAKNASVTGNDSWQRVSLTGVATGTGAFYLRSMAANQAAFWVDSVLVERTSSLNPFYSSPSDFTYAWTGTANASTSTQSAPALTGYSTNAVASSRVYQTAFGINGKSAVVYKNGGYSYLNIALTGLQASTTYTFSADVISSQAVINTVDRGASGGSYLPATRTVTPNTVTRINRSFTTGVGETTRLVSLAGWENPDAPDGSKIIVDNVLVELGTLVQGYFDGTTPAAGDFTYAWAGASNGSVSYQQAPSIAAWNNKWYGNGGGAGVLYQAKGGLSGTYARKLWTKANTTASMDTGIYTGATTAWANTTYTLSAWVRSSVAQNFNFYIEWRDSGGVLISSTPQSSYTAVLANTWTRVSVTGTSPANTAQAIFTIGPYASALPMPEGATLDFDNVLADMYPTVRDYFDVANPIKNMVTNSSFDVDTSGWSANLMVAGHGRNVTRSYTGTHSLWGVANDNLGDSMYTIGFDVDAEATYTLSAYVYVPAGVVAANFRGSVRNVWAVAAKDATPTLIRGADIDFTKTNQWQRISTSIVIPVGSNKLSIRLYFPANSLGVYYDAILLEKSETLNPYYAGQGGFTYAWSGTPNLSSSVQQAPKPTAIGAANQAVVYQVGTSGNYKNRIAFTGNTVTDSGMNFSGGITAGLSKTYTVSMTVTSDIARLVRFSAQGTGVVFASSGNIGVSANAPTRLTWSFSTLATAGTVALYLLRADVLLGNLDVDHVLVEEGAAQIGGYFDGAKVEQNLIPNSNFEVDASGWWPNTGTPTLTSSTDRAFLGTKSLKAVSTVQTSDIAVAPTPITLKADTTYTFSYYAYSVDARTSAYFDVAATNFSITRIGDTTLPAGVWKRISGSFTTPSNIVGTTALYLHHSGGPNVLGAIVYVDCALLEESEKLNQYYEGTGDFTYAWTGTAHASTSVQRGVAIDRIISERAVAVSTTRNGDKMARVISTIKGPGMAAYSGNDVFINLFNQPASLKPNATYTVVANIIVEAPMSNGALFRFNIDGLDQYSPAFPTAVGEYNVKWQFNTGGTGAISFLRFMPGSNNVAGYTNEVILKNFMLIEGPYGGEYFDGGLTDTADYDYAWTGTAHNSTSTLSASKAAGWTSVYSGRYAWTTTERGGRSLVIPAMRPSVDSFSQNIGAIFDFDNPNQLGGRTFTVLANLSTTEALPAGSDGRAWSINWVVNKPGGSYVYSFKPTTTGAMVHSIRGTITLPADATDTSYFRLYNGSSTPGNLVFWDNVMVVEGTYDGDYVDGTKPYSKWVGTANASASIGYPPQLFDIAGKPSVDLIGIGDTGAIAVDGFAARTVYHVYDSTDLNNGSWAVPMIYGVQSSEGITFQSNMAGNVNMAPRIDLQPGGGSANASTFLPNGRVHRRHVTAVSLPQGLTSASWNVDGGANIPRSLDPGTYGMRSGRVQHFTRQGLNPVRTLVYYAEHDFAMKQAVSRYLGNKHGAFVS